MLARARLGPDSIIENATPLFDLLDDDDDGIRTHQLNGTLQRRKDKQRNHAGTGGATAAGRTPFTADEIIRGTEKTSVATLCAELPGYSSDVAASTADRNCLDSELSDIAELSVENAQHGTFLSTVLTIKAADWTAEEQQERSKIEVLVNPSKLERQARCQPSTRSAVASIADAM